jgi:hypothetical protein
VVIAYAVIFGIIVLATVLILGIDILKKDFVLKGYEDSLSFGGILDKIKQIGKDNQDSK